MLYCTIAFARYEHNGFWMYFGVYVVEINAKSILIKNSTVKNIISEKTPSNSTLMSTLMDQLYKETMLRFQIEKKVQALTQKVSKLEKREEGSVYNKPKGKERKEKIKREEKNQYKGC